MNSRTAFAMIVGSLAVAGASGAFAQSPVTAAPLAQGGKPMQPGMMMSGKDGMQSMKMNDHMMQQMSRMMENCNKMMESKLQHPATTPAMPAPAEKQG